ncbi:hypothetical protein DPX39_090034000 [Trypanosoma brucei equiperdum]|uniref:Uncharacterized protein n=1 Tax=Trypanosoma brucei equiperdum TaxID=630700 RepID=A0A3L6L618_9TRYP|nr:hypothetical protein DPX39_090034000 [Trypanosoma brucei equiperdum]
MQHPPSRGGALNSMFLVTINSLPSPKVSVKG